MYGQLIDMQGKLRHAESQLKRRQAKLAKCKYIMDNIEGKYAEYEVLEAEADMLETEADIPTWDMNLQAARAELTDIENLMLELKPQCKYADKPILEMSELAQEDEWLGELKQRVENFLLTAGTIPHDHFQTMRMHPKFKTEIVPLLQTMQEKLAVVSRQIGTQGNFNSMTQLILEIEAPKLLLEN